MDGVIDILDHLANQRVPTFYHDEPPLKFSNSPEKGLESLYKLI